MERGVKRKLAIGAVAVAALGGAGVAYGVTQSNDNGRQAFLNDVAKRLNVTPQALQNALKGAAADRLDAAVKAGKLTQAQADALKQKIQNGAGLPPFGFGARRFGFRVAGGPFGPMHGGFAAAANFLGLTNAQLMQKLQSGKSLADIAADENKSVDDLKNAMKASVKSDLDNAVKNKGLSQAEENQILSKIDAGIDAMVNQKGFFGPGKVVFGGPGPIKEGIGAAAKYLQLSPQQLIQKLQSGKSLADVAGEQNKSVDGLKSAIHDAVKTSLDTAVKNKAITQTQENKILSNLDTRLDTLVNRKGLGPGPGGFGFHRGFIGPRGKMHLRMLPGGAPPPPPPGAGIGIF